MSRSCLWICPFLLALPALARAENAPSPLDVAAGTPTFWRENTLTNPTLPGVSATPVSRAQFFNAASSQIGFVGALKSWRETLRGSGMTPRRDLWKKSLAGGQVAIGLGNVNAPNLAGFNSGAGTSIMWKGASGASFEAGSTTRPLWLDQTMQRFDKETTDNKTPLAALDRTSVTWLRAKPVSTKDGEVEAVFLRAARDGKAGEGEQWSNGNFGSVNTRLSLPARWSMRSSWTSAQLEDHDAASSWNASANGPLSHPWGEANIAFNWRATDAGFETFAGKNVGGERAGDAQITQQIQTPIVSGQLSANASTTERVSLEGTGAGTELGREAAHANADLKLQVLPNLALKAQGNVSDTQIDRLTGTIPSDAEAVIPITREDLVGTGGDLGVEVKVSKALSFEAGAGLTQGTRVVDTGTPLQNLESRATIRLKHKTGGGSWGASLQARDRTADTSSETIAPWTHVAGVGLEGERRLIGDFRLRANVNWMIDRAALEGDDNGVARIVTTQFMFSKAARLDVRYRDGAALPSDLTGDPLANLFSSPSFTSGNREISTRINLGSAANGKGFGMAFEWARQGVTNAPTDSWKVGLTYK
ncbi:hypothetical protein IAD21_03260 [Abditibacteriota bacterium]|nr:hypothetical protein IAD21_03260 [Abditibacteriota bacterium]